jgi:molybdate transport system regulatory protein
MDGEFDAFLTSGELAFGRRDASLLRAIDAEGSLNAAAGSLGRSYSRAHERIGALEAEFGSLVERTRGGSGGGGSALTERAWDLLARFDRLQAAVSGTIDAEEVVLAGEIAERDGELATCETAVGTIRALAPAETTTEADRVQIAIRADAITLHAPAEAPPTTGTSARNRLEGRVEAIEREASVARVLLAPADTDGPSIAALVTVESLDRLDLSVGDPIVATWKATATRATARR